jgi:hypothetical protein
MKASTEPGAARYRRWLTRPGFSFLRPDDDLDVALTPGGSGARRPAVVPADPAPRGRP